MKKFKFLIVCLLLLFLLLSCRSTKAENKSEEETENKIEEANMKDDKKIIKQIPNGTNSNLLIHFDSIEDFENYDPSKDTVREPSPMGTFRPINEEDKDADGKLSVWMEDKNYSRSNSKDNNTDNEDVATGDKVNEEEKDK